MSESSLPLVIQDAAVITLPVDHRVFLQGQSADNYLVVVSGCVKVFARSLEGKKVILYRVRAGEMCILTTACLLGHSRYPAEAITEMETVARVIPASDFDRILNESEHFRHFVFAGFGLRLSEILQRFENMALESIHSRLAHYLVRHADAQGLVQMTHDQLAQEIGTAREVVSRHLKSMENTGLIITRRGQIKILQAQALAE